MTTADFLFLLILLRVAELATLAILAIVLVNIWPRITEDGQRRVCVGGPRGGGQ